MPAKTPPKRVVQYHCKSCDFKGKGPRDLGAHYVQQPTHNPRPNRKRPIAPPGATLKSPTLTACPLCALSLGAIKRAMAAQGRPLSICPDCGADLRAVANVLGVTPERSLT
jgi:hypothetical protein